MMTFLDCVEECTDIEADQRDGYAQVMDMAGMGEWNPENIAGTWPGNATDPTRGRPGPGSSPPPARARACAG